MNLDESITKFSIRNLASVPSEEAFAEIRHDLRNILNQIIGYGEMIVQAAEGSKLPNVASTGAEICSYAQGILVVLRASSAARMTTRHVQALGIRLADSSTLMNEKLASLSGTLDGMDSELRSDVGKLQRAIDSLRASGIDLREAEPAITGGETAVTVRRNVDALADEHQSVASPSASVSVLVVDDNEGNRDVLGRRLAREGFEISTAADGLEALERLRTRKFDLVFLDVMMEGLSGIEVLTIMKQDAEFKEIPVVMISAVDDMSSIVRCVEMGAEDYLPKPFDSVLLLARVRAILERKRLVDIERETTKKLKEAIEKLAAAQAISDELLLNILPPGVAEELRTKGSVDPMYFEDVTIVFTDFVGFSRSTWQLSADELVYLLDEYFTEFDRVITRYQLEKLKTIGDSYFYGSGIPRRSSSHPVDAIMAACEIVEYVKSMADSGRGAGWQIRVGVHTGPVIAGVVGKRKFAFDIWGETVNFASRMESCGTPNRINISEKTFTRVKDFFACEHRGKVTTKEGESVDMYFVKGLQPTIAPSADDPSPPPKFVRRYKTYFQKEPIAFPESLMK